MIPFKIDKALPSNSYLMVTMDWYSLHIMPFQCIFVNSSITTTCTNLDQPSFSIPNLENKMLAFNPQMDVNRTVVIKLNNNLLPNTEYFLQLHLLNVIPNIRKISSSIEMYTVSNNGLVY